MDPTLPHTCKLAVATGAGAALPVVAEAASAVSGAVSLGLMLLYLLLVTAPPYYLNVMLLGVSMMLMALRKQQLTAPSILQFHGYSCIICF